jgi:hypothetical protein
MTEAECRSGYACRVVASTAPVCDVPATP